LALALESESALASALASALELVLESESALASALELESARERLRFE
jgi:hypothetical protein